MLTLLALPKNGYQVIESSLSSEDFPKFINFCEGLSKISEVPLDCFTYISNMLKYPESIQMPLKLETISRFQKITSGFPTSIDGEDIKNTILPVLKYFLKDVLLLNLYFSVHTPPMWDAKIFTGSVFCDISHQFKLGDEGTVIQIAGDLICKNLVFKPIIPGFLINILKGLDVKSINLPDELSGFKPGVYNILDVVDPITKYIINKGKQVDYYSIIAQITADFPLMDIDFRQDYFSVLLDKTSSSNVCKYWQRVMLYYLLVHNNILIDFGG